MGKKMHRLTLYLKLARPHQYVKNGFIWLPLFFGYKLGDWEILPKIFIGFVSLCLAASSVYVLNDIADVAEDQRHPVKRHRPLASGEMNTAQAVLFLTLLFLLALTTALILRSQDFLIILFAYFLFNLAYSFFLKHLAIIDIVCIAVGFVLRVVAGGAGRLATQSLDYNDDISVGLVSGICQTSGRLPFERQGARNPEVYRWL